MLLHTVHTSAGCCAAAATAVAAAATAACSVYFRWRRARLKASRRKSLSRTQPFTSPMAVQCRQRLPASVSVVNSLRKAFVQANRFQTFSIRRRLIIGGAASQPGSNCTKSDRAHRSSFAAFCHDARWSKLPQVLQAFHCSDGAVRE